MRSRYLTVLLQFAGQIDIRECATRESENPSQEGHNRERSYTHRAQGLERTVVVRTQERISVRHGGHDARCAAFAP